MKTLDMRILVTGGRGLLGSALQKVQRQEAWMGDWIFVSSRDADLRKEDEVIALFERVKPTHVIHLAARVGGLFANNRDNIGFFRDNMLITLNIFEACSRFRVEKLISCLSTCIFPDGARLPLEADTIHQGPPHQSNEGYSYAKRSVEILSRLYNQQCGRQREKVFEKECERDQDVKDSPDENGSGKGDLWKGMRCVCIIPTNLFGEHDNFDLDDAHVIPALIHRAYLAKMHGTVFRVSGTGEPLRQFLYSQDAARLIHRVLFEYDDTSPLILTVPEHMEITIGQCVRTIVQLIGLDEDKVVFDNDQKRNGQIKKTASARHLLASFPDFNFTPLSDGLQTTVEWFLNNYPNVRGSASGLRDTAKDMA